MISFSDMRQDDEDAYQEQVYRGWSLCLKICSILFRAGTSLAHILQRQITPLSVCMSVLFDDGK